MGSGIGCLLLCLAGPWACATGPSSQEALAEGRRAFQAGEVMQAYRLLKPLAREHGLDAAEYDTLMREVARAAEYLVELWLEKAEHFLQQGDLIHSAAYFQDLLGLLPPEDGLRRAVEAKAAAVLGRLEELGAARDALVAEARALFQQGSHDEARQKLEEARWQVLENGLEFPLEHERLLEECERRLPGEVEELAQAGEGPGEGAADGRGGTTAAASQPRKHPRRLPVRPRPPLRREPAPHLGPAAAPAPEPDLALVDPLEVKVRALFEQGQQAARKGDTVAAVVAFRQVLRLLPTHGGAKRGLAELEAARQKLVAEWMARATQLFAEERLEEAAPFYNKVLQIDPDNIRAREGRQMYLRLQELKAKQK